MSNDKKPLTVGDLIELLDLIENKMMFKSMVIKQIRIWIKEKFGN